MQRQVLKLAKAVIKNKNLIEERSTEVLGLLTSGYSRQDISKHCKNKWDIKRSQADEYIKKAKEQLSIKREEDINYYRNIQLDRLTAAYNESWAKIKSGDKNFIGLMKCVLQALDQMNKVTGLYSPIVLEAFTGDLNPHNRAFEAIRDILNSIKDDGGITDNEI